MYWDRKRRYTGFGEKYRRICVFGLLCSENNRYGRRRLDHRRGRFCILHKLEKAAISDYVETLEYFTFAECTSLDQIVIGKGVKSVSDGAFYGVEGLRAVLYRGSWDAYQEIDTGSSYNETFRSATIHYEMNEDELIEDAYIHT